jgi:hypothetical protein
MALVNTPLLSFIAHGTLADTITYRHSKRRDVASVYTTPHDPKTPQQIAQRILLSRSSLYWKQKQVDVILREAWRRMSAIRSYRLPPFQTFAQLTMPLPLAPDTIFINRFQHWYNIGATLNIGYAVSGLNSLTPPVSNPDIRLYYGHQPDKLTYSMTSNYANPRCLFWITPLPAYPLYIQFYTATGLQVSGIIRRSSYLKW